MSELLTRPHNTRDKREFLKCPKCKSLNINYISYYVKVSKYRDGKLIKTKLGLSHLKGLTVCTDCSYQKGENLNG